MWTIFRQFSPRIHRYLALTVLNGITYGIFVLDFNLYMSALGYSNALIGIINAIPAIGVVIIGVIGGVLADQIGYTPVFWFSCLLMTMGSAVMLMGIGLFGVVGYVLLFSVGNSLTWILSGPMMMKLSSTREQMSLFSINGFLTFLSMGIGSLLGGLLPEWYARIHHLNPNSAQALIIAFAASFGVNGVTLLLVPSLGSMKAAPPRSKTRKRRKTIPQTPHTDWRLVVRLLIAPTILGLGAGTFVTFQQLYLHQRFHLDPGPVSVILALSQIVTGVGLLGAPWIAARVGRVNATVLTIGASIPFLLLLATTHRVFLAVIALFVRGIFMNMNNPISETLALRLLPEQQRATYAGWESATGDMGRGGLGPAISGILQSAGGFGLAFVGTALCYAGAAIAYGIVFRELEPERRIDAVLVQAGQTLWSRYRTMIHVVDVHKEA